MIMIVYVYSRRELRLACFGRGDETVGDPHRGQISRFELFQLILAPAAPDAGPPREARERLILVLVTMVVIIVMPMILILISILILLQILILLIMMMMMMMMILMIMIILFV